MKDGKEIQIGKFFDNVSEHMLKNNVSVKETLAIHFGYYSNGIKTLKAAILNMNEYIGNILDLKNQKNGKILDAGCGIGGTSLYLAKKYPKIEFIGISIGRKQIDFANNFAKDNKISNVKFIYRDYLNTNFPDNTFNGIFALESASYALDHKKFINEMKRILKPGGRLVIIDGFLNNELLGTIPKKIYKKYCYSFGNTNLAIISKYKKMLSLNGFKILQQNNLNKHVRHSMVQISFELLKRFSKKKSKVNFSSNKLNPKNKLSKGFFQNIFLSAFLGLCKIIGFYSIVSIKK